MTGLEERLRALARAVEYPPTPAVADAIPDRLRPARRRPLRGTRRGLAVALAAAVLLPATVAAAVPPVREAVLDLLGIGAVEVVRSPESPPTPSGGELDLGRRVTLAEAARLAGFAVVTPRLRELGPPDEVRFRAGDAGGAVSIVHRQAGRDLVLTELRGSRPRAYLRKVAGPGTAIAPVRVNGERGIWLEGRSHEVAYLDARGRPRRETLRRAGNTLLWERGPLTLRLEGAASKRTALRIARAVR